MKHSVTVDVDLEEFDTWDLARALVAVAGDHESAHRCIARVDMERARPRAWNTAEQDHAREILSLRKEVRAALELIDRGRIEEGMHVIRLFAAEEGKVADYHAWKARKDKVSV